MGDLGCELGPIVRLEGGRHSKPWEDFSKNKLSHSRGSFVSSQESFICLENISTKTGRNLTLFTGGMWVKSIFQQEDVCEFGGWGKERGENIKICLLTNGTSYVFFSEMSV